MPLLRFDGVSKQYPGGQAALTDLELAVPSPAQAMTIVPGRTPSGKTTTLLRAIAR